MDIPAQFGEQIRQVVEDDVSLPRLYLAFRSPVFGTAAYYDASVAGGILGMRQGSRLYRSLVRERQIAADASAFTFDLAKGSDLLVVDVTARPETSVEKLEQEVEREINEVWKNGVTQEEVDRVIALIQTDMVTALQSASDRADKISMFATLLGDPALVNRQADWYNGVTLERVNAFVREYLGPNNRVKLLYVPRMQEETISAEVLTA
jgi:predicted Zn-dependent peptidase